MVSGDTYLITTDSRSVQKNLADLQIVLSSAGLSAWLSTVIGPYLSKRASERFANEGDDVVGQWAALSPATVNMREEQGFPGGPINHRTGELEEWVVNGGWSAYPNGGGASMRYPKNAPTGELRKKVTTAQIGSDSPRTKPRPVLGLNEADLLFFMAAMQLSLEGALA